VERLSRPRDIEEPFPLEPVPRAVYGVPGVDDRIYLLFLDGLYEGGIGRAGIAYVGVAHDGKGGMLRLDHGGLKTEEYRENKEGQPRELHGRYYIPAREKRKGCRGNDASGRGSVFCAAAAPLDQRPAERIGTKLPSRRRIWHHLQYWNEPCAMVRPLIVQVHV